MKPEPPTITRAQARQRAERHVLSGIAKDARVVDGAEARFKIHVRDNWALKDVWVVYKNPEEIALKSSQVVLVCKRTGRVLYEGPAHEDR